MVALLAMSRQFLSKVCFRGSSEDFTIFFQVADRAMTLKFRQALSTVLFNVSGSYYAESGHALASRDRFHIHCHSSCGLHDAHNSVKWGFQAECEDHIDQAKLLYSVIASMRYGASHSMVHLPQWLVSVLEILPDQECVDAVVLYEVYASMGVEVDILDLMANEMRLAWHPSKEKLLIASSFMVRSGAIADISFVLIRCWRFSQFCSARWMTVGPSCRALALGVLTGFGHMFRSLRRDGIIGDHDAQAGDRLNSEVCKVAVMLGVGSYPAESFSSILLHDGRALLQLSVLHEQLHEETFHVENVSVGAWTHIAKYTSSSARQLRHAVLSCLHVSVSYIRHRFMSQFQQLPWCLTQGCLEDNVHELSNLSEPPAEVNSAKIWRLLGQGFEAQRVVRLLVLLRDCIFTSHFSERMHASAAMLSRSHDYSPDTLCCRAFIHTMRSCNKSRKIS
eukprot:1254799-Amphidinium_carterae.1